MAPGRFLLGATLATILLGILPTSVQAQRFTKDEAASIAQSSLERGEHTIVQWRSELTDKAGKYWGVVDGQAGPGEFMDPATGRTRKMVGHIIKNKVEKNGSTYRFDKAEAEQLVNGTVGVIVPWRNRYTDKAGKDWGIVDGEANWTAVIEPATRKKVEMAGHRIDARVENDGSTFWPDRKQAEQMVAGTLGVTVRWRNKYTDASGKDWDVVDGEGSWGLFQNPETKRYEVVVGLEIYRRVHNNGSTSGFTTDEGERMSKGTRGVGVLTRNGVVGWKPAPLDLPTLPDPPSPGTGAPTSPNASSPTDQNGAQSTAEAGPPAAKKSSKWGWILAGALLVGGCGLAVALVVIRLRANAEDDSSTHSRDSDRESDSEVEENATTSVRCPSCEARLTVRTGLIRQRVRCSKCKTEFTLR